MTMSNVDDASERLSLPDSLLTISSIENAAAIYCEAGLKPLLLHAPTETGGCSCGKSHDKTDSGGSSTGKHPIQQGWQNKQLSYDEIRDQISRIRFTPNIGLILGKQPNGEYLIAIDVDDADRIVVLEEELGPLPITARCDSGRGYRLFFSAPSEVDPEMLQNTGAISPSAKTAKDKIPGVDAKVERGQVVVAPSLHANGKRYVWTVAGPIAPLPVHWALQLTKKPEIPKSVQKYTPTELAKAGKARRSAERYLEKAVLNNTVALASCAKGNRNNTLYAVVLSMFEYATGMSQIHQYQWISEEFLAAAKSCGLPEHESKATIASAERRARETGNSKFPKPRTEEPSSSSSAISRPRVDTAPLATPDSVQAYVVNPFEEPPVPLSRDKRPIIRVTTEIFQNVTEAIRALRTEESLYQRDKKLVRLSRVTQEQSEQSLVVMGDDGAEHHQLIAGTPELFDIEIPTVRELLSSVAVFQKWSEKKEQFVTVNPTEEIVSAVRKRREYPGIRKITGIIETPTLRPDGMVVQVPGYDPVTQYLYIPNCHFPEINDANATQENARWAYKLLSEVFVDFPYVNDSHRAVPIAAILTLVARPAILGSIPAVLFDASTRGSGKTLQTDAIATITTGRGAPRMNYTTDEVELEKILGGYALKGSSFICLDNVPVMRPFGGGPIDRMITSKDDVELRVLGSTRVLTLPWRALIMATGNNMNLYGDTSRRVLMARLEPKEESPEHRTKFRHSDLLVWIRKERHRLVAAALLILRAYIRAGRPSMGCARWGSFEEWSSLIPNAIVFAGGADPMFARPESDDERDIELRSIKCFLSKVRQRNGDTEFRMASIVDKIYRERPFNVVTGHPVQDGNEDLRDAIETLVGRRGIRHEGRFTAPDPTELGKRLAAFKGRVIDGLRLRSKVGQGGVQRWRIEQVIAGSGGQSIEVIEEDVGTVVSRETVFIVGEDGTFTEVAAQ